MRWTQSTGVGILLGSASIANEDREEARASSGRAFSPEAGIGDMQETRT